MKFEGSVCERKVPGVWKNVGIQIHNVVTVTRTVKREGGSGCENSETFAKEIEISNESATRVARHSYIQCPLQSGTTYDAMTHPSDRASSGTSHEAARTKSTSDEEDKTRKQTVSQHNYNRNARDLSPVRKGTPVFVQSLKKYDPVKWSQGTVADNCSDRSYIYGVSYTGNAEGPVGR